MVATMRNHTAQAVRNLFGRLLLGLAPVRKAMVDTMSEVSVGYDHSPLNGPGLHRGDIPAPGRRWSPLLDKLLLVPEKLRASRCSLREAAA